MPVKNTNDCLKIQSDLNSLLKWSVKWKMSFNASKCKILSITRKKSLVNFNYTMNKETVERCYNIKDIGVEIDHKLDWSEHIRTIVKKSNRIMGLIKRTLGYHAPNIVKKPVVHGSGEKLSRIL